MAFPKVKISDDSGNTVGVDTSSNALNVKLVESIESIDIGDVSLLLGGTAADTGIGLVSAQTLRVTLAIDDTLATVISNNLIDCETLLTTIDGNLIDCETLLTTISGDLIDCETLLTTIDTDTGSINTHVAGLSGAIRASGGNWTSLYGHSSNVVVSGVLRSDVLANPAASIVDNDFSFLQVNAKGGLYVTGSEVENAAVQSEPLLIGGRYDSSARTLGDGDAGAVALNASGHVIVEGTVDLGSTDNAVLDAMVVDLAAIEALLITIDSDTNSTQGYLSNLSGTQYVDDADWTDGSSKHLLVGGLYQSSMQSVTDGDVAPFQVDANGVLKTSHSITGGADGVTVVSSAGTDVVLGGDVACKRIDIQSQTDNTGLIAVGFTGVDATEATGTGVILYAGDTYSLEINNLNLIYIDSTVSGEGVRYTYFT